MKKYRFGIIWFIVELVTYFWRGHNNLELFFFVWVVISVAFAGHIFLGRDMGLLRGIRGGGNTLATLASYSVGAKEGRKENAAKLGDISPVLLLIFLALANIVGLLIVSFI